MTAEKPLIELIRERLQGNLQELPVFHTVAVKLQQLLATRSFEISEIESLVIEDQSLASSILKVSNSSYYAGLSKIATIKDAIIRLGAQEIANMAMVASQHSYYRSSNETLNTMMHNLWTHALSCAVGAKWLIRKAGFPGLASEAFMGGLMHDIGSLALLKVLDDIIRDGQTAANFSDQLISEIIGTVHEDVGYGIMQSWNFPEFYCDIARHHHTPEFDQTNMLLVSVRLSNLACQKVGRSLTPAEPSISLFSAPEAHILGLKEVALAELEIIIEDSDGINVA